MIDESMPQHEWIEKEKRWRSETYGISGVRDNSTNDTSDVTRSKSNTKLSALGVTILRGSEDISIESFHDLFEEEELGHGVRDLA